MQKVKVTKIRENENLTLSVEIPQGVSGKKLLRWKRHNQKILQTLSPNKISPAYPIEIEYRDDLPEIDEITRAPISSPIMDEINEEPIEEINENEIPDCSPSGEPCSMNGIPNGFLPKPIIKGKRERVYRSWKIWYNGAMGLASVIRKGRSPETVIPQLPMFIQKNIVEIEPI